MADLEYQQTTTKTDDPDTNQTTLVEEQLSSIEDSPALTALEAKLLRRRKHAQPQTYRRPTYLRYIDYA